MLFSNGSSLYIQMKSTVSPDQNYAKYSRQIKEEFHCVGKVVSLNWSVCFVLFSAAWEIVSIK